MQANERAIPFILITVLLDSMGLGLIIPVTPALLRHLTDGSTASAASFGGLLGLVYAVAQFACAPILGNLSDRFGRRPVLLVSLAAFGLDYLAMAAAPTFVWLLITRAIAGVAGATYATAAAFVADVAAPERRAGRLGLIGAAFGIGFIVGPAIGGLLGALGTRAPFYGAAAIALANVVYGFFVLPESLPLARRRAFSWARANAFGSLRTIAKYPGVLAIACAQFAWFVAFQSLPNTWAFATIEKFGWTSAAIGASLAFSGVLVAVVQGGLVGAIVKRVGERRAGLIGLCSGAIGFAGYALAPTGWVMYLANVPWAFGGLVSPSLGALMSREAPPDAQGEMQGAIASVMGLSAIVGPVFMTQLFAYFSKPEHPYFPGASFAAASLLAFVGAATFAIAARGFSSAHVVANDVAVET